jgi:hypothetical protein
VAAEQRLGRYQGRLIASTRALATLKKLRRRFPSPLDLVQRVPKEQSPVLCRRENLPIGAAVQN